MKKIISPTVILISSCFLLFLSCRSENNTEQHVEDFRWKINQPKFTKIELSEKGMKDIQAGKDILEEKNANVHIDNKSKNYFTIRKSELGKIQVNKIYHENDLTDIWEEYLVSNRDQISNSYEKLGFIVDGSSSKKIIDKVEFDVLHLKVLDISSGTKMNHLLYKKYYPEKKSEFVISVTYASKREKKLLLNAINNSTFY